MTATITPTTTETVAAGRLRRAETPLRELLRLSPPERIVRRAEELGYSYRPVRSREGQWSGPCPAHVDVNASFSIGTGDDGNALVKCFAGCATTDIVAALGLTMAALYVRGARSTGVDAAAREREALATQRADLLRRNPGHLRLLAEREGWTPEALGALGVGCTDDDDGRLVFAERDHRGRVVGSVRYLPRYARDAWNRRHHDVEPGSLRGFTYRNGGILRGGPIMVVEGPSTALAAMSLGYEVVGFPSARTLGAEIRWRTLLTGEEVVVIPDADDTGRNAADALVAMLRSFTGSVALADLHPNLRNGRDLADDLRENGAEATLTHLAGVIGNAVPVVKPKRGRPAKTREVAEEFLREALADGRWHPSTEIRDGRPQAISLRTYADARKALGVESRQEWEGGVKRTVIRLPGLALAPESCPLPIPSKPPRTRPNPRRQTNRNDRIPSLFSSST